VLDKSPRQRRVAQQIVAMVPSRIAVQRAASQQPNGPAQLPWMTPKEQWPGTPVSALDLLTSAPYWGPFHASTTDQGSPQGSAIGRLSGVEGRRLQLEGRAESLPLAVTRALGGASSPIRPGGHRAGPS